MLYLSKQKLFLIMAKKSVTAFWQNFNWDEAFFWFFCVGIVGTLGIFYPQLFAVNAHLKQLFIGVVLLVSIAYTAHKKQIKLLNSTTQKLVGWSVIAIISATVITFFYASNLNAWWGSAIYFSPSVVTISAVGITFYFVGRVLNTKKQWLIFVSILFAVICASISITAIASLLKNNFFAQVFGAQRSTLDTTLLGVGVWAGVLLIGALGFFIQKNSGWLIKLLCGLGALAALILLCLISYPVLFGVTLAGVVVLLAVGLLFNKETEARALCAPGLVAALLAIFMVFGSPFLKVDAFIAEPVLPASISWQVVVKALGASPRTMLFGSGFGSFPDNFLLYRNPALNLDSNTWNLRFFYPASTQQEILNDGGLLLWLAFLFWAIATAALLLKNIQAALSVSLKSNARASDESILATVGVVWFFIQILSFVIRFGFALWFMWWLLAALIWVWPRLTYKPLKEVALKKDKRIATLVWAGVGIGFFIFWLFEINNYIGAVRFNQAQLSQVPSQQINLLEKAAAHARLMGEYQSALAQAYFLEAQNILKSTSSTAQAMPFIIKSAQSIQKAVQYSPLSAAIWESASELYANMAALPGARAKMIFAAQRAGELDPTNPMLAVRLGDVYAASKVATAEIQAAYEHALMLKPNWSLPYSRLAGVSFVNGATSTARAWFEKGLAYAENDQNYLFQYGYLLYTSEEKKDEALVEQLWLRCLEIQPDFVEPIYGLAELYKRQYAYAKAAVYYKKVLKIQPSNAEVKQKLEALQKK